MTRYEIKYGSKRIPFELVRSDRKTLETRVKPDCSVEVRAPGDLSTEKILEIVSKRGNWITKKITHFKQYPRENLEKRYVSGETHRYLGKQYRLKLIRDDDYNVKLKGKFLEVHTPDDSPEIVENLLYNWYRDHAEKKFDQILDEAMSIMKKHGLKRPELRIKRMKRRWGSCIAGKNRIHLNLELIITPTHCIEYVMIHELVHMKIPNHQKEYYRFLDQVLPNWRESKKKLEHFKLS